MTRTKLILPVVCAAMVLGFQSAGQAATVTFYNNKALFDAATTTALIDFEGIVPNNTYGTPEDGVLGLRTNTNIGGVNFSVSSGSLGVSGSGSGGSSGVTGSPYNSALLFSNNDGAITATVGPGVTAVGGFFGDINGSSQTTLTLVGNTMGVLDMRNEVALDMGLGSPTNFYGWVVTGDTIRSITHSTFGSGSQWEGIDDFQFGTGENVVPEPTSMALFGLTALGFGVGFRRRRGGEAVEEIA